MDRLVYEIPDSLLQVLREYAHFSSELMHEAISMTDPPAQEVIDELGEEDALEFGENINKLKEMDKGLFSCIYTFGFMDGFIHAHRTLGLNSYVAGMLANPQQEEPEETPSPKLNTKVRRIPDVQVEKTPESIQDFMQMLNLGNITDLDSLDDEQEED